MNQHTFRVHIEKWIELADSFPPEMLLGNIITKNCLYENCMCGCVWHLQMQLPATQPQEKEYSPIPSKRIVIEILLHPTYGIPCPYLRIFDSSGTICSIDDDVFSAFGQQSSTNFVLEEHPGTGLPWYALEICGLKDRLELCALSAGVPSPEMTGSEDVVDEDKLYLLRWLSVVGPQVGLAMSCQFYMFAMSKLILPI